MRAEGAPRPPSAPGAEVADREHSRSHRSLDELADLAAEQLADPALGGDVEEALVDQPVDDDRVRGRLGVLDRVEGVDGVDLRKDAAIVAEQSGAVAAGVDDLLYVLFDRARLVVEGGVGLFNALGIRRFVEIRIVGRSIVKFCVV